MWKISFSFLICLCAFGESLPKRITSSLKDLGEVQKIYMIPGMATLIEIPSTITGIRTGNPEEVTYLKPNNPDNEVTLIVKSQMARPTNLIIRSGKKKYVFDVVPSKTVHQDYVEITGSYGGPETYRKPANLIDSSER